MKTWRDNYWEGLKSIECNLEKGLELYIYIGTRNCINCRGGINKKEMYENMVIYKFNKFWSAYLHSLVDNNFTILISIICRNTGMEGGWRRGGEMGLEGIGRDCGFGGQGITGVFTAGERIPRFNESKASWSIFTWEISWNKHNYEISWK